MNIRRATRQDIPAILDIVVPTLRSGETYAIDRDMTDDQIIAYWMGPDKVTLVAEEDGEIVGTYYIRQNQGGGGSHVCNCGYMTSPNAAGRGVARHMGEDSFVRARELGYRAMQYNFVIACRSRASLAQTRL